jgi:hypothetical protein
MRLTPGCRDPRLNRYMRAENKTPCCEVHVSIATISLRRKQQLTVFVTMEIFFLLVYCVAVDLFSVSRVLERNPLRRNELVSVSGCCIAASICHSIKIYLREIGLDGMDWIDLAQDRDQWRAFVNIVMNLRVP